MADPESVVSPGGVGFDINCGVRLIRTNLVSNHHASHLIESAVAEFSIVMSVSLDILRLARISCRRCSQQFSAYEVSAMLYACQFVASLPAMLRWHAPISTPHMQLAYWQMEADVTDVKEQLAQTLFDHIPVGVGSQGIISTSAKDLEAALEMGMDWSLREVSPSPPLPSLQGVPAFIMSCCLQRMPQHLFSVLDIRHDSCCTQSH